jgi:PhnB protein
MVLILAIATKLNNSQKEPNMVVQPYLFFEGCCEEALDFYRKTLGAEVLQKVRFSEGPKQDSPGCPDMPGDKIMHVTFKIGETTVMASDGRCSGKPTFTGFSLSAAVKDVATAEKLFAALGEGGQVQMPMMKTFFSPAFGMVADRFGVSWMVIVM